MSLLYYKLPEERFLRGIGRRSDFVDFVLESFSKIKIKVKTL
jgi:hypothetical protein